MTCRVLKISAFSFCCGGEELVLVLRGRQIVNDILEAPTDLGHVSKTKTAWHRIVLVLAVS